MPAIGWLTMADGIIISPIKLLIEFYFLLAKLFYRLNGWREEGGERGGDRVGDPAIDFFPP